MTPLQDPPGKLAVETWHYKGIGARGGSGLLSGSRSETKSVVIVGASLAGGRAAEALRSEGFDGRIVLVGAETERPYERPPLSKELLQGSTTEDKLYLRPPEYYAEQQIELCLGARATHLDPTAHHLELADGQRLTYDRLLIATGAAPRRLAVPGADLDGLLY